MKVEKILLKHTDGDLGHPQWEKHQDFGNLYVMIFELLG